MSSRRTTAAVAGVVAWSLWMLGLAPGAAAALAEDPAVDVGGSPLPGGTGSTDPANPTVIEAGLWADTLGDANTDAATHQFRYVRAMKDSTVHVGVIAATTDPEGDQVDLTVTTPDDTSCASDSSSTAASTWQGPYGAAVVVTPTADDDTGNLCVLADTLDITVSRSSSSSATDLPIAVKVVEEAPALGTDRLEQPAENPTYRAVSSDAAIEEVEGSTSFADAPSLDGSADGVRVKAELTEGDVQLFRVPLTWGQSLTASAELEALTEAEYEALSYVSPEVRLVIVDPIRNAFSDGVAEATESGSYTTERTEFGIGVPPVRYLSRRSSGIATVPGDYWIALIASPLPPDAEREPIVVPVELRVAVEGDVEDAPPYAANVLGPNAEAGPDGYSPEEPFLVGGTDDFSAVASGNPGPPKDTDEGESWWGSRHVGGLGLGAVSLLLCVAGAVGLARRRA